MMRKKRLIKTVVVTAMLTMAFPGSVFAMQEETDIMESGVETYVDSVDMAELLKTQEEEKVDEAEFTVTADRESYQFTTVDAGEEIHVTTNRENAYFKFRSDNYDVINVTSEGFVRPWAGGTANIIVQAISGSEEATLVIPVTVSKVKATLTVPETVYEHAIPFHQYIG